MLKPIWGPLGLCWAPFGAMLIIIGISWGVSEPYASVLVSSWGVDRQSWSRLAVDWSRLGATAIRVAVGSFEPNVRSAKARALL